MIRQCVVFGSTLGQIGLLGDRFQDEIVRCRAALFRRLGVAGFQFVGKTDGCDARASFRGGVILRKCGAFVSHEAVVVARG